MTVKLRTQLEHKVSETLCLFFHYIFKPMFAPCGDRAPTHQSFLVTISNSEFL